MLFAFINKCTQFIYSALWLVLFLCTSLSLYSRSVDRRYRFTKPFISHLQPTILLIHFMKNCDGIILPPCTCTCTLSCKISIDNIAIINSFMFSVVYYLLTRLWYDFVVECQGEETLNRCHNLLLLWHRSGTSSLNNVTSDV